VRTMALRRLVRPVRKLLSRLFLPEAAGRWSTPAGARAVTGLGSRLGGLMRGLGHLETRLMRRRLAGWPVDRPIYVCGIARAGTTVTLELLHRHPEVATHRYFHLPLPQIPCWSARLVQALPLEEAPAVERIHADRLRVTKDSPEMVEERLWMAYFPDLHSERRSGVLDARASNPRFTRAYADHIRKLCCSQGRPRYAAKNNNLITRLPYLVRLFPDARILLVVRRPLAHVASLEKQQRLFERLCADDPRLARYMAIVGHYEFGPHQRFLHAGDDHAIARVRACWDAGQRAEAWGRYWACLYGHVRDALDADPTLAATTHVVRYEDLCRDSGPVIDALLRHAALDPAPFAPVRAHYAATLTEPDYYRHGFSGAEVATIEELTAAVAARYGY
jgi:hypothetical protein